MYVDEKQLNVLAIEINAAFETLQKDLAKLKAEVEELKEKPKKK